ncbi:MAG: type II secretion system F family protein [Janthinobacterium lividum]
MKYGYKAISETGVVVKGILQSLNELSLKNALDQQKFQLIKISSTRYQARFKKFSLPLLEEFCLQMAIFNRAGLTILQSLELLRDATENNSLKQSLIQIIDVFQSGLSLSKSFAYIPNAFDPIVCSMIEAGEKIGSLTTIFDQLAQLFKWQYGLKNQIWTSLQYPFILSAVVLGLIGLMFTWTIPQMADFFTSLHKELSFSTRFLFMVSEHSALIIQSILCVIFLLVTTVLSIRFLSSQGTLKIHQIYMGLPAVGKIIKKIDLHRFLQVFISLIKANISLN